MKKIYLFILSIIMTAGMSAQEKSIELPKPDMSRKGDVMQALQNRKSTREFSTKELSRQDLADLLWAACGVNRPDGRRTAGSAMNRQDCDVYVVMKSGAYLYDSKNHRLTLVKEGDLRGLVAGRQSFVLDAPASLVIVSDYSKMGEPDDPRTQAMCAVDAGIISQNISIFCASAGLATVARASMEGADFCKALGLSATQHPLMNHPVGYMK